MRIRTFESADEIAVIELWRRCGLVVPQNDPHKDVARKMRVNPELFLVGEIHGKIVAAVMAGYEGHRGAINYLAVDPSQRKKGLGQAIMAEAERLLRQLGCCKINLNVRTSNAGVIEFYKRIGFSVDDVLCMGKRLESDQSSP
jgi:ribosomal protein S18 acetylase RimI-like enzyme